jgi:hypothetical protein
MMGLEPTTSCATSRRSNRLSYIRRNGVIIAGMADLGNTARRIGRSRQSHLEILW